MKTMSTMSTGKNTTKRAQVAMAVVAAALAGALSIGQAAPALADEQAPDQAGQQQVALDDASADEGAWDATATEDGFSADANSYAGQLGVDANGTGGTDASQNGVDWWRRCVSPWDALESACDYLGFYDYDSWDYQVGRFRGTPAYRIEIDVDGGWHDWNPYYWGGRTRYVVFVNYFTGRVMAAYADYE